MDNSLHDDARRGRARRVAVDADAGVCPFAREDARRALDAARCRVNGLPEASVKDCGPRWHAAAAATAAPHDANHAVRPARKKELGDAELERRLAVRAAQKRGSEQASEQASERASERSGGSRRRGWCPGVSRAQQVTRVRARARRVAHLKPKSEYRLCAGLSALHSGRSVCAHVSLCSTSWGRKKSCSVKAPRATTAAFTSAMLLA